MKKRITSTLAPIKEKESNSNIDDLDALVNDNDIVQDYQEITNDSSLDSYVKSSENKSFIELAEKDVEINELKSAKNQLEKEKNELTEKVRILSDEIKRLNSKKDEPSEDIKQKLELYENQLNNLVSENDEYILKNSELTYQITVLNTKVENLQKELDKRNMLSSKPSYTISQQGSKQVSKYKIPTYIHKRKDGYQEWY